MFLLSFVAKPGAVFSSADSVAGSALYGSVGPGSSMANARRAENILYGTVSSRGAGRTTPVIVQAAPATGTGVIMGAPVARRPANTGSVLVQPVARPVATAPGGGVIVGTHGRPAPRAVMVARGGGGAPMAANLVPHNASMRSGMQFFDGRRAIYPN